MRTVEVNIQECGLQGARKKAIIGLYSFSPSKADRNGGMQSEVNTTITRYVCGRFEWAHSYYMKTYVHISLHP